MSETECQVSGILFREGRSCNFYPGQVDSLVVTNWAARDDPATNGDAVRIEDAQFNPTVSEQNFITLLNVFREISIRGARPLRVSQDFFGRYGKHRAGFEHTAAALEFS